MFNPSSKMKVFLATLSVTTKEGSLFIHKFVLAEDIEKATTIIHDFITRQNFRDINFFYTLFSIIEIKDWKDLLKHRFFVLREGET